MDFGTLQVVETVVFEKCQAGDLFTAYDITKEVRNRVGRGTSVLHNDVKQEVHNMFANGQMGADYTRNLGNLSLPAGVSQPWVYHRTTDDVVNYGQNAAAGQSTPPPSLQVSGDDNDDGVNKTSDGYYRVDARETLCVPKAMLAAIGLNPADEAYVSADALAGHVVVTKGLPDQTVLTPLSTYTVDKYGNVRITQATLVRGGVGGKEFEIEGDSTKVILGVNVSV